MTAAQVLSAAASLFAQAGLVILATEGLSRFARDEKTQSRLWAAAHWLLLALTVAAFAFPHLRLIEFWPVLQESSARRVAVTLLWTGRCAVSVWLVGVVLLTLRFCAGCFVVQSFLRDCDRLSDLEGRADIEPNARLQSRPVEFLTSSTLSLPFCWWFHRPLIVLPRAILSLDRRQLGLIVRHELEHLRQNHSLQLFIQRIVEILFWPHPAVWWSSRQAELTRESACDEAATASCRNIAEYLRTLLRVAESGRDRGVIPGGLQFASRKKILSFRIRRLLARAKGDRREAGNKLRNVILHFGLFATTLAASFVWIPVDAIGSSRSAWTPWPTWSANVMHSLGLPVRDFDVDGHRFQPNELLEDDDDSDTN